jgi:hypothetical protein
MSASVSLTAPINSIPILQNSPEMLKLLRAKTNRYDLAQRLFSFEVGIAASSVFAWLLATAKPNFGPFAALLGLIGVICATWLEKKRHAATAEGAAVQELFDTALFQLEPRITSRSQLVSPENITSWAADYSGNRKLTEWYAVELGALPLPVARVACQRANAEWDATMRQRFSEILTGVLLVAASLPLLVATLRDESVRTLNLWLFASTSFLFLCFKAIQSNRDVVRRRRQVQDRAESLWNDAIQGRRPIEELAFESRALQDEIWTLRLTSAPLFDWAYTLYRARQETCMKESAQQLVDEYERLERGQIRSSRAPYS